MAQPHIELEIFTDLLIFFVFSDLEKHAATMTPGMGSSMGNVGILSLDPIVEKQPVYQQLLATYGWSNKVGYRCFVKKKLQIVLSFK